MEYIELARGWTDQLFALFSAVIIIFAVREGWLSGTTQFAVRDRCSNGCGKGRGIGLSVCDTNSITGGNCG